MHHLLFLPHSLSLSLFNLSSLDQAILASVHPHQLSPLNDSGGERRRRLKATHFLLLMSRGNRSEQALGGWMGEGERVVRGGRS